MDGTENPECAHDADARRFACQWMNLDCWMLVAEKLRRNDRVWFAMACKDFYFAVRRNFTLNSPAQSIVEFEARIRWALLHLLDRTWNKLGIFDLIPVMAAEAGRIEILKYAREIGLRFHVHCLYRAAARGRWQTIKFLHAMQKFNSINKSLLTRSAVMSGCCETFSAATSLFVKKDISVYDVLYNIVEFGNAELFERLLRGDILLDGLNVRKLKKK